MKYSECNEAIRRILARVDEESELGLVELLGDMDYGVLEKVLTSEVTLFIAGEFGLEPDGPGDVDRQHAPSRLVP